MLSGYVPMYLNMNSTFETIKNHHKYLHNNEIGSSLHFSWNKFSTLEKNYVGFLSSTSCEV